MSTFVRLLAVWTALTMSTALHAGEATEALIYKTPQCGCCDEYADYLRQNGFKVTVRETHQLAPMSRKAGILDKFEGCHLAHIDGYVVSGHVPVTAIRKLLKERPSIAGITLPGMPLGSPGMGGARQEPFKIYEIGRAEPKLFMIE
jgi:hypothetical protein